MERLKPDFGFKFGKIKALSIISSISFSLSEISTNTVNVEHIHFSHVV